MAKDVSRAHESVRKHLQDGMDAIADLNQDISTTPTEAEVQAISDKIDVILAALRTWGVLAS